MATETRNITIIRPDNVVIIDGKAHGVDLSSMQRFIQAVQWNGKAQKGHIEFVQEPGEPFALNIDILDVSGWTAAIEAWQAAEDAEAAAAAPAAQG